MQSLFNYSEYYLQGPLSCSPDPGRRWAFLLQLLAQTDPNSITLPQLCCTPSPLLASPASCLVSRALPSPRPGCEWPRGSSQGPRQRWSPRWALKPSLILSRLCSRARNDSHSLRRRAWAFQGPSRLSTHGHAFTHTQTCTNSIPFTPGVQACVPCVHKHRPCVNNTQICTHMHTHTRMHLHKSAPGTCQPLTLPSQGHYPRSSLCLGGTCLDTCLAPSLTS